MRKMEENLIKLLAIISYLVMIAVNAMANILPINGVNTGQVSDFYKNLFAPAGLTFAIWGLIYLLLGAYVLYQAGLFNKDTNKELLYKVGVLFSISSFANASWIFAWHYKQVGLSVVLMIVILTCLIITAREINNTNISLRDKLFVRLPFSIYFGWITVATIANITALLVSLKWEGFGLAEEIWTVIIIAIGFVIGALAMIKNKDIEYGLVIVWAYIGILIKHTSISGFQGQYPKVIVTTVVCILLILFSMVYMIFNSSKRISDKKKGI